jgi:hypothetical protein
MRATPILVVLLLAAGPSHAQSEVFFGSGGPPSFSEQDLDRRFTRSRLARGLAKGSEKAECVQLLGGLLTVLAEAAPTLHRRDENFYLDPSVVNALNGQLTTASFPGNAYLALMVRRVLIDGRLPPEWLALARSLNGTVRIIDLAKLSFLADGVRPVDSFYFSFAALRERYDLEVKRANSASRDTALLAFRDAYLDREVAWGGLTLLDIAPPGPAKKKKGKAAPPADPKALVARLQYVEPAPPDTMLNAVIGRGARAKPNIVEARLSQAQYVDLSRLPKGSRLLVRGRFFEMSDDLLRLELREALLFEDRDWSGGALLADPAAIARCPLALNELSGVAPVQPGGFGTR